MVKKSREHQVGFLHPIYPGHKLFELVHIDHLASFVKIIHYPLSIILQIMDTGIY